MVREWLRSPRQLRFTFLAIMLLLSATLGWLAWRLLAQDQQLATQRLVERRETAADLAVVTFDTRLAAVEQDLDRLLATGEPPTKLIADERALVVVVEAGALRAWPAERLIYYPELPERAEAPRARFAVADELEFSKRDYPGAIAALSADRRSRDATIRAAAWVRIARNHVKRGQAPDALKAYEQLRALDATPVGGMPAVLAADVGRGALFEQQKDRASLSSAAHALARDLESARWPITFATYQYLSSEVARWLSEPEPASAARLALAHAVAAGWERWTRGGTAESGREHVTTPGGPVLLVWRSNERRTAAFIAPTDDLGSGWLDGWRAALDARQVRVQLTTRDGLSVLGTPAPTGSRATIRLASETHLPWTLQVFNVGDDERAYAARRRLLVSGMAVFAALILVGSWFIGRSVTRELAVARLQSDFVSAVSHEFRTPLTTLCQLSELLMAGRVAADEDRRQYYELLHNESHRLRRLVEGLLNFGRLEAGRMQFRFEPLDVAALVRDAVGEFLDGPCARSHRFEIATRGDAALVMGDRDALRCVLSNLFENAVKYSPQSDTVWVDVARHDRRLEIAVRDQGLGIPRDEQRRIFDTFVRGSTARDVRGTGVGLAMARQIVVAHGGDITVESEPGKGSTFTIVLPTQATPEVRKSEV